MIRNPAHRQRATTAPKRLARALGAITIAMGVVLGLTVTVSSAAHANGFARDGAKNTYTTEGHLSAQCPQAIAATSGSDPADLVLDSAPPNPTVFGANSTFFYVYGDNARVDATNFALDVCIVSYPASKFVAGDFNANGQLTNGAKKSTLTQDATEQDKVQVSGIPTPNADIFFSWTPMAALTAGDWLCAFARDVATGHGGGGNRKVPPVCGQVKVQVTPAATWNESTICGGIDTYTLTNDPGVAWLVDTAPTAAGTYQLPAGTTVSIEATPAASYYYFPTGGQTTWSFRGSAVQTCTNPTQFVATGCGVNDTYTLPNNPGVVWTVNGGPAATLPGTYDLAPDVVVNIVATGAMIGNWSFTGSDIEVCPLAATLSVNTTCGAAQYDSYTIPTTTGVDYIVNSGAGPAPSAVGTFPLQPGVTVSITASASGSTYVIATGAASSWGPWTGSALSACNVTPAAPTTTSACGVSDTFTIPTTNGVNYVIGGATRTAGTYPLPAGTTVKIDAAAADANWQIDPNATAQWAFTGAAVQPCGGGVFVSDSSVTPAPPRHLERSSCGAEDRYVIPETPGVTYLVDGDVTPAGTYDLGEGDVVDIVARANAGFVITNGATGSWTFTGSEVEACPVGAASPTPPTPPTTAPILAFTPDEEPEPPAVLPQVTRAPTPTPAPTPPPVLAFTGLSAATIVLTALFLLGIGTVLLVIGRRETAGT